MVATTQVTCDDKSREDPAPNGSPTPACRVQSRLIASDRTMAASSSHSDDQAAAPEPTAATPAPACCFPRAPVEPLLLMAALRGDSELLKGLLQIEEEEDANGARTNDQGDLLLQVVDSNPSPSPPPPPTTVEPLDADGVTMEGDTLLHVVAASGETQKYLDCAKIIYDKGTRLLVATNSKGDTPLHCAAGAGNAKMISRLIDLAVEGVDNTSVVALVRMQNECGETALHHAVRAASKSSIDQLMAVDSDLACIPHDEEEGSSPLYLAISVGEVEIAEHLYVKSEGKLSYGGPDGRNVLHAAVSRGREEALRLVLGCLGALAEQQGRQGHPDFRRLLSQLTSQRDDENGSTPLHLAASLAGFPFPWMYKTHPRFWGWSGSPARLLLEANECAAYLPDKGGLYPIHVAAGAGSVNAVDCLLGRCPACATLRDAKGRTFLHIAVEEGRYSVVRYVCNQMKMQSQRELSRAARLLCSILNCVVRLLRYALCCQRQWKHNPAAAAGLLSSILNAQDINGDTPLHRAVHAGDLAIFNRLVSNQRVRLDVPNKQGIRPIDVAWSKMPLSVYYAWDSRIRIQRYLLRVGAPHGEMIRGDRFDQKRTLPEKEEEKMSTDLTAAAQVLCIFSVLITTVTFASAFTLPGGYRSAGDAASAGGVAGTPVLAGRSYAFDAFVLSDTLAFLCSLNATALLLYAGVACGTLTNRFGIINLAYTLMWHAARSLLASFGLGLYIVLLPVARTIAIVIGVSMVISLRGFFKASEGIDTMAVRGRSRVPSSAWRVVLDWIIYVLDYFWSYIIIFGVPAIRKWARLH